MFHTLSFEPPRPHSRDVLDARRGLTFGNLITSALGETTSSLGTAVVTEPPSILEALRPHFNEDEKARVLLGEFFASVVSPELLRFEKGDDEVGELDGAMNRSSGRDHELFLVMKQPSSSWRVRPSHSPRIP